MTGRTTPPDIQDGPLGYQPREVSNFDLTPGEDQALDDNTAIKIAREAWDASTNWMNSSRRAKWTDSLRAFQSLHPSGSKYLSRDYSYRSTFFRPKTRAMVRRDEAATASAFFANEDVVSIQAENDDDPAQQASAELLKALLQYRLTKTIPWFLTLVGARQDAEVMGVCVAKVYWQFEESKGETAKDRPWIDLIPPENFRFEPGADWRSPVETSPYLIHAQPIYIDEAMEKIRSGEWFPVPESALHAATDLDDDTTRRAREANRVPGKDHDSWKPRNYDVAWVRDNIVRWRGEDYQYYTLGSVGELLTRPRPLREVHLHGQRPYVVGSVVLETHKTFPSSKVEITRDLQRAANEDWNLRFDLVKLNANPRQFVKAGAAVDLNDIRTFMPGKVVVVNTAKEAGPESVVSWDRPPPPDQTMYAEQDRINLDFDELTGAFSNSSVQASQIQQQSASGMHLMSGEASGINEYELRVFAETFVEPAIRLLIKLEQAYETDPVILGLAGRNAQLFQRFRINKITDDLLNQEVTTRVNVGIGATNPQLKMRNFFMGAQALGQMYGPTLAMGTNFEEVAKEVFALMGYKDGDRFFQPNFDPRVAMLQQQLQQHQKQGGGGNPAADQMRLQAASLQAQGRMAEAKLQQQTDLLKMRGEMAKTELQEHGENMRAQMQREHEFRMTDLQARHQANQAATQQQQQAQVANQGHEQLIQHIQQLAKHVSSPRRVVRDHTGRISGVQVG